MDADDISLEGRFEQQLSYLEDHPNVDVVGGWIEEFSRDGSSSIREVPSKHDDIVEFAQRRSPMNHVSVMMRRDAVLNAGNYREMDPTEDYDLWMRMLHNGSTFHNIPEVLVRVRGGREMQDRRGGWQYARHEIRQYREFVSAGAMTASQAIKMLSLRTPVRLLPGRVRRQIYQRFVRA